MAVKNVLMIVKPKFSFLYQFIRLNGFYSLIHLCFGSLLMWDTYKDGSLTNTIDFFMIFGFAFILFPLFLTMTFLFGRFMNYHATNYKVYDDSIEFEEGFINHKYATLRWMDIKEIHFTQGFFQRMFGIGHINFITAANTGNNGYNDGIKFRDIQKPKEIYDKLKYIHNHVRV